MGTEINGKLMQAVRDAEGLAQSNPGQSYAVILCVKDKAPYYSVAPENDPVPEGAQQVTTLTRHPLPHGKSSSFLFEVVRQVLKNLPADVELLPKVLVEHFPKRMYENSQQVFAYQFMSTDWRNVATWIPSTDMGSGALMQPGFDGRGRIWKNGMIDVVHAPGRTLDMDSIKGCLPAADDESTHREVSRG